MVHLIKVQVTPYAFIAMQVRTIQEMEKLYVMCVKLEIIVQMLGPHYVYCVQKELLPPLQETLLVICVCKVPMAQGMDKPLRIHAHNVRQERIIQIWAQTTLEIVFCALWAPTAQCSRQQPSLIAAHVEMVPIARKWAEPRHV